MKQLISTGGSTIQEIILSQRNQRFGGQHDPWGAHAVSIIEAGTFAQGISGAYYGFFRCILKDGNDYCYMTPFGFSNYDDLVNWLNGWLNYFLPSGEGPYIGEGWNYGGRVQHQVKFLTSDYTLWFNAH